LSTLPALDTWPNLNYFIGWNIEEQTGKVLKKQLATLEKERTFKYASVSNLKKPEWFITEFGIPFGVWPIKNNKVAVKAYKDALKVIKKASSIEDVQEAIKILVEVINDLPNIETTEREDTWEAVMQLVSFSTLEIEEKTAGKWFDQYRDF
jgi:TATA-box binding protein (TBP) (component of TFIID and TFIIIB)